MLEGSTRVVARNRQTESLAVFVVFVAYSHYKYP